MKLLMLLSATDRGGAEEYALTISTAATKAGWSVHAVFPEAKGTTTLIEDFATRSIPYHRLNIVERRSRSIQAVKDVLVYFVRTLALLLKIKPDVVLINLPWADHCLGSILACGWLQLPTAVVFHLIPPTKIPLSGQRLKAYTWARGRNQQWITNSEDNCRLISELFQMPREDVLCIYNGTKLPSIDPSPDQITVYRHQVRQELNLSQNSRLILTIGRLVPQKGYADLIPVIPQLVEEFPDVMFVWLGEGEQRQELQTQLKTTGVEDHVLLLGHRSDLPRFLQASDIFLFPTRFEGHPFSILEAMAYRLPIVSSNASSIPEVIDHQVHGLLFRTRDRQAMLESLRWALQHPEQMQQFAHNAQQRVQAFSQASMIEKTLNVLQDLGLARTPISLSAVNSSS